MQFNEEVVVVLAEIEKMLVDKNRKYGDSALSPVRCFSKSDAVEGIKVRIDDKISRMQSGQTDEDEDVEKDLLGYLVMLQIARRRLKNEVENKDAARKRAADLFKGAVERKKSWSEIITKKTDGYNYEYFGGDSKIKLTPKTYVFAENIIVASQWARNTNAECWQYVENLNILRGLVPSSANFVFVQGFTNNEKYFGKTDLEAVLSMIKPSWRDITVVTVYGSETYTVEESIKYKRCYGIPCKPKVGIPGIDVAFD